MELLNWLSEGDSSQSKRQANRVVEFASWGAHFYMYGGGSPVQLEKNLGI